MTQEETFVYAVHCLDDLSCGMVENESGRFGGSKKRITNYAEHRNYQTLTADPTNEQYIKKIGSGPLESDDGKYMIGSFFLLEATRNKVDEFLRNDIFTHMNVWEKVSVHRWVSFAGITPMSAQMENNNRSTVKMISVDTTTK